MFAPLLFPGGLDFLWTLILFFQVAWLCEPGALPEDWDGGAPNQTPLMLQGDGKWLE